MPTKLFTKNGKYLMLAFDHRESFIKSLNKEHPENVTKQQTIALKRQILEAVMDKTTGILIDQDYGLPAYDEVIENTPELARTPFLLPSEKSGYAKGTNEEQDERLTQIQYPAESIKKDGATGVKLLVYFNTKAHSSPKQLQTSKIVLDNAHLNELPLFLEIVTYKKPTDTENPVVYESVKMFLDYGIKPDVFKLEYPGSVEECKKISELLRPHNIPWILLTRGVEFEEFCKQLEVASLNGCVGFLAGRSVWQEATTITDPTEKAVFFKRTLPERFERISRIVETMQDSR